MDKESTIPNIADHSWSRILVLGGLAELGTEEVLSHLSYVSRQVDKAGQRIACVLHIRGKGVSPRAMLWAQSNGRKHAPFLVSGRGKEGTDSLYRVFEVGKPSVCLVFPGMALNSIRALDQARKRQVPIFHIDSFYPKVTKEDCKALGISYKKATAAEQITSRRACWNNGTVEEVLRDNTFINEQNRQQQAFAKMEEALKNAK